MRPLYLYMENFQCHEKSEIDFSSFNAALLVGRMDNNDLVANGVGKSSIFKAIEYVLYNQVRDPLMLNSMILECLVRDDTQKVSVIFDFQVESEIYRIIRSRTRKGVSDFSFYKRNAVTPDISGHSPETDKKLWDDISSRRTKDTEADLAKKIKIHYKAFINMVHFMQSDMTSLATATPEKRKLLLRETLELLVYSKLEKIAKMRADVILKDLDKDKILLETLGLPDKDIEELTKQIQEQSLQLVDIESKIEVKKSELELRQKVHNDLKIKLSGLEKNAPAALSKRNVLRQDIEKLDGLILDFGRKRKVALTQGQELSTLLINLKNTRQELEAENFSRIAEIKLILEKLSSDIGYQDASIKSLKENLEELRIPMPEDGTCKHCRQILTEEHRYACQIKIDEEINKKEDSLKNITQAHKFSIENQKISSTTLIALEQKQKKHASIVNEIVSNEKEFLEKKKLFQEYQDIVKGYTQDLTSKKEELIQIEAEIKNSSNQETNELRKIITDDETEIAQINAIIDALNKSINTINEKKAVLNHSLQEKESHLIKKQAIKVNIASLEGKYAIHPLVIQAFGTTGIPNLIIQNVLEDYQEEANNLLSEIRPGLQLTFSTEKTKGDGSLDDTLDLNYFLNNKERDYSQLSGAQRLCIAFALKLGLALLLSKMLGSQIQFLLLDELDQGLDKASTDAFAKIIKHFQKDFTILVITHNDRLKDKFSHAILVEQDQNMVSKASVVSSW